jgi:hypothetical protein
MSAAAQPLLVALIVGVCTVYAAWVLLPSAARRPLAITMLRWPLPALLLAPLRRAARPAKGSGCACDGCGHAAPKLASESAQRITFHPRVRR